MLYRSIRFPSIGNAPAPYTNLTIAMVKCAYIIHVNTFPSYAWYVEADTFPPRPVQFTWCHLPSGYLALAYSGLIRNVCAPK